MSHYAGKAIYIQTVLQLHMGECIRLKIEGAVELYENDTAPLRRLALENDMLTAAAAFDTIGSALYDLRQDIRDLHATHIKESIRQARLLK